ncbi:zinc-dependent metalloprotease [Empedobacter stercoris]|uniref:Zinc-dependent metalloprotease n=1 Tax=Empedobacter falsenii TaxID=343874 RepID=A0ABY8VGL4_9FLAO|nr:MULTISPECIES: zinc-dependent metalloprotease [Empedobacter]UWX68387.1 zinc-dependent metalloprotease [Empedobacter stercoris]WIH98680.1 zinc-dependent metalloprotease [Empedobacter falsenii]HJD87525.1 zinc-dependent metalloprotease [Empedobacter falsenii]
MSSAVVYGQKKEDTKTDKEKIEKKDSTITKVKKIDELIKKGTYKKGLFNTIQVKTDIYFEIPDSLFGRQFLVVNKLSQVPMEVNEAGLNKGMNYENKVISFYHDKVAKKVWVKTLVPQVSSPKNDAITASVKDNFSESIIEVFDIEAQNNDSTAVAIKVNKIFDGNQKSFNDVLTNIGLGGSVKANLSYVENVKTFPENIVVKSQLTTSVNEGGVDLAVTLGVTSNIVLLSTTPMQPRLADNRVGYFTEKHWFFNDAQHKMEDQRFITKWRLEPKDEDREKYLKGELVEPKKPIIYYIDPSTPKQWRQKIIAGVHDWQVAFEQAGFKNAIIAKEPTADDKDFDIDDVRYSVITYAASPKSNAMGPSVVDPRSGEILEADIIWWHNVMTSLHDWMRIQTGPIDPKARGNKFSDEHMGEAIRFVSSHEVGHTFGLKHNMGSSFSYPVESLRSKEFTDKMGGTAPSIMDYARYNYVAQPEDGVTAITPKIGLYDKYAIEWGYRWFPNQETEKVALRKMIEKHEDDPMYFYGEQQSYLSTIDPRSQSEDLGNDAVLASEYGMKNLKRVSENILKWTYEDGKSYINTGKLYYQTIGQWDLYSNHVLANVGGIYLNNTYFGIDKKAYEPVSAAMQRKAVNYLNENVINLPKWLFFNDILEKTYAIKNSPMGPYEQTPYTLAREMQYGLIYNLFTDDRLLRMLENELNHQELKSNEKIYTVENLFDQVRSAAFDKKSSLTILERMTQKNYVDALIVSTNKLFEKTTVVGLTIDQNLQVPTICNYLDEEKMARNINYSSMKRVSEVTTYKRAELQRVLALLNKKKNNGDASTKAHYADLIIRIKEALK